MIVLFIVTLFVGTPALTATTKTTKDTYSCSLTEFRCSDGACVSAELVCDGSADCADQSDETSCTGTQLSQLNAAPSLNRTKRQSACRNYQWECRDGSCIFFDGKCDGVVDCTDGSDETHALCRKNKCQSNWFRCTYGACVDGTAPCNGVQECADGSDELLPRCRKERSEVRGQFTCADGSPICAFSLCDGVRDCADGSDETVRACAGKTCPFHLFQCAYGACVDSGADCNKTVECADGSDESEELCETPARIKYPRTRILVPEGKCVLPPYPEHGTFTPTNYDQDARPGHGYLYVTLNVTCDKGYRVINSASVSCQNGMWMGTVPECIRHCRLDSHPSVDYQCLVPGMTGYRACNKDEPVGTTIRPICRKPNYYSPSNSLEEMVCKEDGYWDKPPRCSPECGRVTPSGEELAVGGHDSEKGELPWHAGVYWKEFSPYKQICGGSLISSDIVLSAAHCFYFAKKKKLPADQFAIAVGKIYRPWNDPNDNEAQISDVKEIHLTEHYQGTAGNFQDDIAIVIVTEPFQYKTFIRPVCLDFDKVFERQQLQASNKGKVAGWGLTAENGIAASVLQVVDLPYVNVTTCIENSPSEFSEYITSDKICAGSQDNTTALCHGDSGGGLAFPVKLFGIERFYLRGVASTAPRHSTNGCNTFAYASFTQISKHEDFIKQYWKQA